MSVLLSTTALDELNQRLPSDHHRREVLGLDSHIVALNGTWGERRSGPLSGVVRPSDPSRHDASSRTGSEPVRAQQGARIEEPTMEQNQDAVVLRKTVDQAYHDALGAAFMERVSAELAELEPHVAWALSAYERTALGAIAGARGSLSRKDVLAIKWELRNIACLVYRCLADGYREQLFRDLEGLEVNNE